LDHPQRLLVVAEPPAEARLQHLVQRLLARVPEGRMPQVMAVSDRLGQVLVQPQRPRDRSRDPAGLERVREPGAVVVTLRCDENLGLVLQPAKALGMHHPVAIALKRRSQTARFLWLRTTRRVRLSGER